MSEQPLICPLCGTLPAYAESDPDVPVLRRDSMVVIARYVCPGCFAAREELHEIDYSAETVLH